MSKRPPPTGGRRSKLTSELIHQFEAALQNHATVAATCEMLGVSRDAFYRWLREGEDAKGGVKRDFYDTVKRAQGMSQVMLVNKIANDPSWQAKAWLLERLHPQTYGRRQLIALAGHDGDSPMPTGATAAVKLTINMTSPDGTETPWTFKDGQDEDDHNASDTYQTDVPDWDRAPAPPLEPAPPPLKPSPLQGRGPATGKAPQGISAAKIIEAVKAATKHPMDTGGRPIDPDES